MRVKAGATAASAIVAMAASLGCGRAPAATPATVADAAPPSSAGDRAAVEEPGSCAKACATDADCACGTDRATGACAIGRVECIDRSRQCPDFCGGIDGRQRTACVKGTCSATR